MHELTSGIKDGLSPFKFKPRRVEDPMSRRGSGSGLQVTPGTERTSTYPRNLTTLRVGGVGKVSGPWEGVDLAMGSSRGAGA